jgi:intracellular multiplication protein IcmV
MKKIGDSKIAGFFKGIFKFRAWTDYDRVKENSSYIYEGVKKFTEVQQADKKETFEEALKRLNISEHDLDLKQKALFRLSILMLCIGLAVFFYALFKLWYEQWFALFLCSIVIALSLSLSFRYHFWHFQIKHRKLGCTFEDWYRKTLLGEKS